VELFEEIRRGYAAGETIKSLARKHCQRDAAQAENDEPGAAAAGTGQAIY